MEVIVFELFRTDCITPQTVTWKRLIRFHRVEILHSDELDIIGSLQKYPLKEALMP